MLSLVYSGTKEKGAKTSVSPIKVATAALFSNVKVQYICIEYIPRALTFENFWQGCNGRAIFAAVPPRRAHADAGHAQ